MHQQALSLFETADNDGAKVIALGPRRREGLHSGNPAAASEDALLGHLVWSSVSDAVRLTPAGLLAIVETAFGDANLLLPQAPTPASALSRAADAAEVRLSRLTEDRHGSELAEETYANVLFRTAARGVKQMVTEILDASNNRLSYQPLAGVSLVEGSLKVERILDGDLLDVEKNALANLHSYYARETGKYDGEAVRRVLGRVLRDASAIPLRSSGGMYFIPRENAARSRQVLEFVEEVRERAEDAPGKVARPSSAMSVPLVDTVEYREVLADSLDEHVEKESKALISEMARLLRGDAAITTRRQKKFVERVKKLKADVSAYEALLEIRATDARSNLDLAMKEAQALLSKGAP